MTQLAAYDKMLPVGVPKDYNNYCKVFILKFKEIADNAR